MGEELLHAHRRTDRSTDMTKLIVAFRNFANSSKKLRDFRRAFALIFSLEFYNLSNFKKVTLDARTLDVFFMFYDMI